MFPYYKDKGMFAAACLVLTFASAFSPLKASQLIDASRSPSYITTSDVWQGLFAAAADPEGMPNGFDHHYDNLNHSYDSQGVNRKFYEQRSFASAH